MKCNLRFVPCLLIFYILVACSSSENINHQLPMSVVKNEITAWLNLMPGSSPGKFHVAGELVLKNIGAEEIKNLELIHVRVYSEDVEVYSFIPYFTLKKLDNGYSLAPDSVKEFSFGTENGLRIVESVEKNNVIKIKLIFSSNEGSFDSTFSNIEIIRTY